jgi:energy-coupling factor transport system ATP-binding protein
MNSIIKAEHVWFDYSEEGTQAMPEVLRDLSVEIERGGFTAILGHNGSGKSTLAKLFNGILTPKRGRVTVDGLDTANEELLFEIRKRVGMVFQNPDNQIVATTVEEDVAFGPENLGVPSAQIRQRVDEALKTVGMEEYARRGPHQLSGGQKQRVAIAGIIAMFPECIIFDESTAMLDPKGRREIIDTIKELNRDRKITVILITHYMNEAIEADRVIVMNDGKIELDGTPEEVFSQVEALRGMGLDVPQATELLYLLEREGLPFPRGILQEEDAADAIVRALEEAGR